MGHEIEIQVDPGLSSLTDHLVPLLRDSERLEASSSTHVGDKPPCPVTTDESRATEWPHCCEFILEAPNRIYVLAHFGIYMDIAKRLVSRLEATGHSVEVHEI